MTEKSATIEPPPMQPPSAQPQRLGLRVPKVTLGSGVGLIVIFVLVVVIFSRLTPLFLTTRNLLLLLQSVAVLGMIAVFSTMLMVGGGLDLSVGATTALVGVTIAVLQKTIPIGEAVTVGLLIGLAIGLINGLLVTQIGINALITTLGMLSVVRGLAFVVSGGIGVPILNIGFLQLGGGKIDGIPIPVIVMAILFIVAAIIMQFTTYGRAMYAIGGNNRASYLAALPVKRYQMTAYLLSAMSAAVAGVFLISRQGAASPNDSNGFELSVVAAVILGGTSLSGGKGNLFGTLIGVLILGTLSDGMTLLSVNAYYQQITLGVVLLLAVGLDQLRIGNLGRFFRSKY